MRLLTDGRLVTTSLIKDLAQAAYSGWTGWHHSWHWPKPWLAPLTFVKKIRAEAEAEAGDMKKSIDALKARRIKTLELCDICDGYIAEIEADESAYEEE